MHRDELISVPALLLDTRNARLKDEQPTQQDAILALTTQQGRRILALAEDIVGQGGLDPLSALAVVESATEKGHYVVIEGNRRLVALRGLQTPSLVLPALDAGSRKRWGELSKRYAAKPVGQVRCVVFDAEEEAIHWVSMRHTGQNNGAGIVEWGADEKDRFRSRHGVASRAPAGQILDFVDLHDAPLRRGARLNAGGNLERRSHVQTWRDHGPARNPARRKNGSDVVSGAGNGSCPGENCERPEDREDARRGHLP